LAFDVIDNKVRKIAGNTLITIGNKECGHGNNIVIFRS